MTARRPPLTWRPVLILTIMWILLWRTISPLTVLLGIGCAILVLFVFPLPSLGYKGRISIWGTIVFFAYFFRDMLVASIHVAWFAIRPQAPPKSAIVALHLRSKSDLVMTMTAEVLALIPGSIPIEASQEDHTLYMHFFDVNNDEQLARVHRLMEAQEARIVRAIGTDEERAMFQELA